MVSLFNLMELAEIHRHTQLVEACGWDESRAEVLINDISDICESLPDNPDDLEFELQVLLQDLQWSDDIISVVISIFNEIRDEYIELIQGDIE